MNFENIIVIGVCFVAIAIVAYYFYSKYTSQQRDMNALSKRFESIEMMFLPPHPLQNELSDVYNRKHDRAEVHRAGKSWENTGPTDYREQTKTYPRGAPVPIEEINDRRVRGVRQGLWPGEPLVPSKIIMCEVEGLCDLQPLEIETNNAEIDEIVEDEINKVMDDIERSSKKMSPKTKNKHN